jgi:hypothetical protein
MAPNFVDEVAVVDCDPAYHRAQLARVGGEPRGNLLWAYRLHHCLLWCGPNAPDIQALEGSDYSALQWRLPSPIGRQDDLCVCRLDDALQLLELVILETPIPVAADHAINVQED